MQLHVLVLWGHVFCQLSRDRRLFISQRLKKCSFYGEINRGGGGGIVCPLHGGSPYLGESVMGGSTIILLARCYVVAALYVIYRITHPSGFAPRDLCFYIAYT